VRKDLIIRLIALIVLCGLVYYFSFEQGRSAVSSKTNRLEAALAAKERVIESQALEINRLQKQLEECPEKAAESILSGEEAPPDQRITIRQGASRIVFNGRLALTCLEIDRNKKTADLRINLVQEDRLIEETIGLGQGLRFTLSDQEYTLILDQLQSSFVSVQLFKKTASLDKSAGTE
jgi:F0F1-type ATP synthase membrane subunit b/b'